MRVLVIGGTRFIGPPTVELLVAGGHDVSVFHRGQTEANLPADVAHLHGERARLADFAGEVRGFAPDVALDMGAMCEDDARAVIDVARGVARRLVAISSVDVYRAYGVFHGSEDGPPEPVPLTEDSRLRGRLFPYGGTYDKIPVERAVLGDPALPGTVLRLPAVHGERDYQRRLMMEVVRIDDGRPLLVQQGVDRWRWPRAYAGNVAAAIALAVTDERAAGRVYNVAEPEAMTYAGWVRAIGRAAGREAKVVVLPAERMPEHLRSPYNAAQDMAVDSSRIRRELGYAEAVAPEEGLARAVAWERAQRPERLSPKLFDYAAEDAALAAAGAL